MESLTKELGTDVVLSAETAARLAGSGTALRPLGDAIVRGKARPIEVFAPADS